MNTIIINGNLANDAKINDVNGKQVCNITLICNQEKDGKPLVFSISYWNCSENLLKFLTKGKKISVTGYIRKIEATTKDENTYVNTYVTAYSLELLGDSKPVEAQNSEEPAIVTPTAQKQQTITQDEDLPF